MKKNGFIATSILYSFFLLFISLFVATIGNYLHNQALLTKINDNAMDGIVRKSSLNINYDFLPGEYFRFKPNRRVGDFELKDDNEWMLLHIDKSTPGHKTLTFISTEEVLTNYKSNSPVKINELASFNKNNDTDPNFDKLCFLFSTCKNMNDVVNNYFAFSLNFVYKEDINYISKLVSDDDTYKDLYGEKLNDVLMHTGGLTLDRIEKNIASEFKTKVSDYVWDNTNQCFVQYSNTNENDSKSKKCLSGNDNVAINFSEFGYGDGLKYCIVPQEKNNNGACAYDSDGIFSTTINGVFVEDLQSTGVSRLILRVTVPTIGSEPYQNSEYRIKYGSGLKNNPYFLE